MLSTCPVGVIVWGHAIGYNIPSGQNKELQYYYSHVIVTLIVSKYLHILGWQMKKGEMHPLRIARCQHNLTIVELAEEAKVGASTIWRAEHYYSINAESRRRLCAFFAMAPQELGLLGRAKQVSTFERTHAKVYPFIEPCTPIYVAEKVPVAQLLALSEGTDAPQFSTQEEQSGTVSVLEASGLATLLDSHWTLDTMLNALRIVFQGLQLLPSRLQHSLLLGMVSRTDMISSSDEECSQVTEALSMCIAQSEQFCRTASPIQVLIVGQGLFYLLRQMQKHLALESYRSFYESITNLIGSVLFFQEYYKASGDALQKEDQGSQESLDIWKQAQHLSWKATAAACVSGKQFEPIQFIETALRLLEGQDEKDYPHILADNKNSLESLSPVFGQQPSFVDY
jgi:hypothetical protein